MFDAITVPNLFLIVIAFVGAVMFGLLDFLVQTT